MKLTPYSPEWLELSRGLEKHHSIFYKLWEIGRPVFRDDIPTAQVAFDPDGEYIAFEFNPKFWSSLTLDQRMFVVSHECLHVALNHGLRTLNTKFPQLSNIALDLVVNHSLADSFGFDRASLEGMPPLCWLDTIFPGENIKTNETFEYYYTLLAERTPVIVVSGALGTLDNHDGLSGPGEPNSRDKDGKTVGDKLIEKINRELSEDEKNTLKGMIEKHFQDEDGDPDNPKDISHSRSATGTGGWVFVKINQPPKKKKWETVIKKWSRKYLKDDISDHEQWARENRRIATLRSSLMLPSDVEDDIHTRGKIKVFFFLDTSGSCYGYKERFFEAALSLPTERFDIRLFCFDTAVQETTLESRKIYGGGGTSFHIIEAHIQKVITAEKCLYPEAVFLITDGYGDTVKPAQPDKWYWFLTYDSAYSRTYIPKESKIFNLQDFE